MKASDSRRCCRALAARFQRRDPWNAGHFFEISVRALFLWKASVGRGAAWHAVHSCFETFACVVLVGGGRSSAWNAGHSFGMHENKE